ncbi:hypothetical protein DNTS_002589 [Danionella cerebrum]|uniref:DM domain-containing protein n=1 Tax=Danionella cerebrum TaxID=2873325 RepID=A0A553R5U6_9TELE|nr:hypothetical protein DNTS_002589 [Danionella translucida]
MSSVPPATQSKRTLENKSSRLPKCARCRNHGFTVQLKGHSGKCQFKECSCWKCSLINQRTRILASQRRIKSVEGRDSLSGRKTTSPGDKASAKDENRATRDDSGDKSYADPRATFPNAKDQNNATMRSPAVLGDLSQSIGESIFKEPIHPGEIFAMPLPLYPHYSERYMVPALLVSLRQPAPETFRDHVGMVPLQPGMLTRPLDNQESPIHVSHYSQYPPYPEFRDHPSLRQMDGHERRPGMLPQSPIAPDAPPCKTQDPMKICILAVAHQHVDIVQKATVVLSRRHAYYATKVLQEAPTEPITWALCM